MATKKPKAKKEILSREGLLEALNRLDEFACEATRDNDNGEAQQQEKDYNMLHDFISKLKLPIQTEIQQITVPMSESDCEEVREGDSFDWTFPDQYGNSINVHIELENLDDEDEE